MNTFHDETQKALKSLRDLGIIVVGIGLTEAGEPAKTTYAPNAQVVSKRVHMAAHC